MADRTTSAGASTPDSMGKPAAAAAPARARSRTEQRVRATLSFLFPLFLILLVRIFLVEPMRIPSGSMVPSILIGDWLFVNKVAYGPRIPFTSAALPGYDEPARGDVVVFESPYQVDQPWDPTPTVVKRLVAVGGDTIHMRAGLLHVNGMPRPDVQGEETDRSAGSETSPLFDWQRQYVVRGSRFGDAPAVPTLDDWGPLLVPQAHLFMLGDARYNSKDNRYTGMVPRGNVIGRPTFVFYSYNADDSDRALPWLTDIRWGRLGDWIE